MSSSEIIYKALLDSFPHEIVFVDCEHKIKYMNSRAILKYDNLIGTSIFDCHKEHQSHIIIKKSFESLKKGENAVHMYSSESSEAFMIAVRDSEGNLLGYWECIFRKEFKVNEFLCLFK